MNDHWKILILLAVAVSTFLLGNLELKLLVSATVAFIVWEIVCSQLNKKSVK